MVNETCCRSFQRATEVATETVDEEITTIGSYIASKNQVIHHISNSQRTHNEQKGQKYSYYYLSNTAAGW